MSIFHEEKPRRWPYMVGIFFLILFGGSALAWNRLNDLLKLNVKVISAPSTDQSPQARIVQNKEIKAPSTQSLTDFIPAFLGTDKPRTYLVLFLNNTEMRPGGGFIGSYAVVKVANGAVVEMKVEGSEGLDRRTPKEWHVEPPKPIKKYLGVDNWYFRDSNWSPDFVEDVQKAVAFYQGEKGLLGDEIDTVIAVTPTVLEELLRIIGPVVVDSKVFSADNVTEKLEYDVEYGYKERGTEFTDRKELIEPLLKEVISKATRNILRYGSAYIDAVEKLGREKHILAYSRDPYLANFFDSRGWTGRVENTSKDYLLWVDANLAALKTDHAMQKDLAYSFASTTAGFVAKAKMTYIHNGSFDWRTSRYRTYARVFVPLGAKLKEVKITNSDGKQISAQLVDSGEELNKSWFGTFISIEPEEIKSLEFSYILPPAIKKEIDAGNYGLIVQKQLGSIRTGLTLSLDFGKTVLAADPGEESIKWGDVRYDVSTNLQEDKEFGVAF